MKNFSAVFEKTALKVVEVLSFLLFGCIVITEAFSSVWLENGYGQKLILAKDHVFLNLLVAVLTFFSMKFIADWMLKKNQDRRIRILLIGTVCYAFSLSLIWAAFSKCFPTADQASVYYGAKHFAADYYGDLAYKNSYFSCYPHQMGLALYQEILFRIFHTESFHLLQGINAVCNGIIVWTLYRIVKIVFHSKRTEIYVLLLSILCFPLFWYTPFVYGELPSLAFAFLGVWFLLESTRKEKNILWIILSLIAFYLASLVRKNTLILVIAVFLTLTVWIIREKRYWYILYELIFLVICTMAIPVTVKSYEFRSGKQLNDGEPWISFVVMGLQEKEGMPPGWYNGYNFTTYAYDSDYDQKKAISISQSDLREREQYFAEHPKETGRFFFDKFRAEWLNTGFSCFDFTAGKYYDRHPVVESFFSGKAFYVMRFVMDKYQFYIFLFAFIYVFANLFWKNQKQSILDYIFLVTILGGAVFYLVWEGNGRYVFPYFVMALPYAAAGMEKMHRLKQKYD